MRFSIHSLHTRIVVLFAALLVLVQGLAFLVVNTTNTQIAKETIAQELGVGERIFLRLLTQQRAQLEQTASLLAAEFGFRQAVASNDRATIQSALANHGARASASVMLLISLDRQVLVDTLHQNSAAQPFDFLHLIRVAEADGKASGIVTIDGGLYQLVVVPVNAPTTIAWVGVGFAIDDKTAEDLKNLAVLDVSFLSRREGEPWRVHASTLSADMRQSILAKISGVAIDFSTELHLEDDIYTVRLVPIDEQSDTKIVAVLQRSLAEGIAPFQRISSAFLILAAVAVLLSVVGSILIAENITRPINALADAARHIQDGDYTQKVNDAQKGEIGALASTFNHMLDGIATREKENLRLAFEDNLTGLPNRAMFHDRLAQALLVARRQGQPLCVMMLDLDRFKHVNDTLGHPVGDLVLAEVALRLRGLLRESDSVARLGGDEFAILLASGEPERASAVAKKVLHSLEAPIMAEGQPIDVGTSIGIVYFPEHGEDANALLRRADIAMYAAKRAKSGFATYEPQLDEGRQDQLTLLGELRRAIEQNELVLYYQPKFHFATNTATGMEALIRWEHPMRGNVSPADFIPFAEQTGNIRMITRWAIDAAIAQCGRWIVAGHPLRISINISARDLLDKELVSYFAAKLTQYGVPPELICAELTESALMEDPAHATETLGALHRLGIKLSMDDYGTGYSSLAYIKDLSLDELKIDRAFVSGMSHDAQSAAIVHSTIELGHRLGMIVVAEGVETGVELGALKHFGCDYAQGYYVSRPMKAEAVIQWLIDQRAVALAIGA
ncbi:MAG: EAL domain-containing protein [Rhodocyclaceae bacterium]|nr:EAL domain-containing protein [Rhodocyclaceae bacterium]MBP6110162.1 EAL domain-containing protein [Rhodocyclaceae bacterium]MBP6279406.1 EAL domain-containing protein [Rhodocyclaceae bacterium]